MLISVLLFFYLFIKERSTTDDDLPKGHRSLLPIPRPNSSTNKNFRKILTGDLKWKKKK